MKIAIHTKGILGSRVINEGEEADAMFSSVLEVDGHVLDKVTSIDVKSGEDFTTVKVVFIPGEIDYINHSGETWAELMDKAEEQRSVYSSIRRSDGRTVARHEG
jgi:hypothetical protein